MWDKAYLCDMSPISPESYEIPESSKDICTKERGSCRVWVLVH